MFLQIHTLTSFHASLLNRDDAGLAKRIPFGNATRLRVSSQCLKRHWRDYLTEQMSDLPDSYRSRSFFTRIVLPRALAAGIAQEQAISMIEPLAKAVIDGGVKEGGDLSQPVLLGTREADYFVTLLRNASQHSDPAKALSEHLKSKEAKDNLKALRSSALGIEGLTASLFGRMVTSDLLARVDAPVHVAHAFSTHAANTELDFFTVVDDLNRGDETGAAHANQTEIGGAVYYGYVAVDVPLLVSNLTGLDARQWRSADLEARALVRRVLTHLVDAIAQQSPGAKLGSTAPYALADLVLLETGAGQPRALSNAFLQAVRAEGRDAHPLHASGAQLARYLGEIDAMYGAPPAGARHLASTFDLHASLPARSPLPTAVAAALDGIFGAQPQ